MRISLGVVLDLAARSALTLDSPDLLKATKQFPENALLAGTVVVLTEKAGKPLTSALVNAIKAKYSHFSPGGLLPRPSAAALRRYFAMLQKELANAKDET